MPNLITNHFSQFYQRIATTDLCHWLDDVPAKLSEWKQTSCDKRVMQWIDHIDLLPNIRNGQFDDVNQVSIQDKMLPNGELKHVIHVLKMLMPWRKGPYSINDIHLDCEWRSDWKWQRIAPHISNLNGKNVLDVGCNNGYHMWRMLGAGANLVIGIDPVALFLCQFLALKQLFSQQNNPFFIPLGIEAMPSSHFFDAVFSMGVLYHRRSPFDHLIQLKNQLNNGGELILETLVIDGNETDVLVPNDRYAKMKNVYFIPSIKAMIFWLKKVGFNSINVVDVNCTTIEEQRATEWMQSESLSDFLDKNDPTKTIEGYPAPKRATFIAKFE